jgi:ubiquinone/menaquinone biosynthesis C-methylase UbiE
MSDVRKQQSRVRRLYSLIAGIYDLRLGTFLRWRKPAVEALQPESGDTVLDLACGTGLNLSHIVKHVGPAGRIIGLDYTRPMLTRARKKIARGRWMNVSLVEGDAANLPLATESCDGIICSYAMAIIPEYRKAVTEAVRVLKPGGRLVLLEPNRGTRLWAKLFSPIVALSGLGFVDLDRKVWQELPAFLDGVQKRDYAGGLVYIANGTKKKES